MSFLIDRARAALVKRQESEDGIAQMNRQRDREDVASRVALTLECEKLDFEAMEAAAGEDRSTLWRITVDGVVFLAGIYWANHPGPPGRRLFLGLLRSPIRGRYNWPLDVNHDNDVEVPGTTKICCLADLAEAMEQK